MPSILSPNSAVTARTLWREYTNEQNNTTHPDAVVDTYLQAGLDATNRRIKYHYTDDSSSIVLVAGTQEYALPADCIEVVFVEWNGKELAKRDMDSWRNKGTDWRRVRAGAPLEWAHYGSMLVLVPAPDAAAVSAAASPVFRYISTARSITTYGMEQLNSQDQRLPVYWGVAEYSVAYPNSAQCLERAKFFTDLFDKEILGVKEAYAERLTAR